MGVYINGMKMPKDCRECPFEGYHANIGQTYCMACLKVLATAFKPISFDGRSKWCPLVEVPEPHGRLIDADALVEAAEFYETEMELNKAKTVIEAEGGVMDNQEAISVLESINAKTDYFLINDDSRSEALDMAISALQAQDLQPTCNNFATDVISRRAALDAVNSEIVSTNPDRFKSSEKFIKFMDDADIASFGKWQWANGFNTAVVATKIQLEKLPSAQPEIVRCKDCRYDHDCNIQYHAQAGDEFYCGATERRTDEGD